MPDLLVRKAYTAAYDRRLRHPSWVSCVLDGSAFAFLTRQSDYFSRRPSISLSLHSVNLEQRGHLQLTTRRKAIEAAQSSWRMRLSPSHSERDWRITSGVAMIADICELNIRFYAWCWCLDLILGPLGSRPPTASRPRKPWTRLSSSPISHHRLAMASTDIVSLSACFT